MKSPNDVSKISWLNEMEGGDRNGPHGTHKAKECRARTRYPASNMGPANSASQTVLLQRFSSNTNNVATEKNALKSRSR